MKLKDIGLVILSLHWILGYILRYNLELLNDSNMNLYVTFCGATGMSLIAFDFKLKEKVNWKKYAFYNAISLLGGVIVLIYVIDIILGSLIITNKPIYVTITCVTISLCIYFLKR